MIKFAPLPTLTTDRLILRSIDLSDVNDIYEFRNNLKMVEFVDSKIDENINDTLQYIEKMNKGVNDNKWVIWVIALKNSGKVIGSISIWNLNEDYTEGELGYGINPIYQNQGYMQEVLNKLTKFAFKVYKMKCLYAYTEINNASSIRLLEKCNFVKVNQIDEEGYYSKKIFTMLVYKKGNN